MNFLNMPKIIMFLADGVVRNKGNEYRYIDIFRAGESEADYPEGWLWSIREFIINGRKKIRVITMFLKNTTSCKNNSIIMHQD